LRQQWAERPEGGGVVALRLFAGFSRIFGRGVARLMLYPITLYFLLRREPERRASFAYLARVLPRKPTWWHAAKHMHCFSSVVLDRLFLMTESFRRFDVRLSGIENLREAWQGGRGVLIYGAHLGSFDALRVLAGLRQDVKVRVVIDIDLNPALSTILNTLNPAMAASIIRARQDGTTTALAIKEALDEGAVVTLLVDRPAPGNPTVTADLLGSPANFPASPWLLAAALKVPVVLCFGVYRGGNRYDLTFEAFATQVTLQRSDRERDLRSIVQRFAGRLDVHTRAAPYNWFNFYDFWQPHVSPPAPPRDGDDDAPHDDHGERVERDAR
jgi:predicted LPLAT superfamily acyltransferase